VPVVAITFSFRGASFPPISYAFQLKVTAQPFGLEARFFLEKHMLQREITVTVNGLDKFDNFVGDAEFQGAQMSVLHSRVPCQFAVVVSVTALHDTQSFSSHYIAGRNIATEMIRNGFGKIAEWSLVLSQDPVSLRAAESSAKKQGIRIWKVIFWLASELRVSSWLLQIHCFHAPVWNAGLQATSLRRDNYWKHVHWPRDVRPER
jgi:endonuclease YncB( thermonuclease family)